MAGSKASYKLVRVLDVGEGDVTTASDGKADECGAHSVNDPGHSLHSMLDSIKCKGGKDIPLQSSSRTSDSQ